MKRIAIITLALAALVLPGSAAAAPTHRSYACPVCFQQQQTIKKLRGQITVLKKQLAIAQQGVVPALSTMSAWQLANDGFLSLVYRIFNAQHLGWENCLYSFDSSCNVPYARGDMSKTVNGDGSVSYDYDFSASSGNSPYY